MTNAVDGDKYGVRSLAIGQTKTVAGATPLMLAQYLYDARKRRQELRERKFRSRNVFGGIVVERVR